MPLLRVGPFTVLLWGVFLGYQIRRHDLDTRVMEVLGDWYDNLNARAAREYLREIDIHEAMKKVEHGS